MAILATKTKNPTKPSRPTKVEFSSGLQLLKDKYPDAHCALDFKNAFELLVATILSAQCTDERVNIVTKKLFRDCPTPADFAKLTIPELETYIHSTGFYRNKAKNIWQTCKILVDKYGGIVPKTMEQLYELPGVGRKTANCVLGNAYNISSGVVVDTHVTRLSNRFGWVKGVDAVKIEQQLNKMCPQEDWIMLSHYLISHGRAICKARSPDCHLCFLQTACPRHGV